MTDKDIHNLIEAMKPIFTTKEDLEVFPTAEMVLHGFEAAAKKADVDNQFADVHAKLDRIENILLADHKKRIEKLEQAVNELKEALAM